MNALFQSVRFRLTLWYALVLAFVLSAFGGLTYGLVRYQLVRHHDRAMREAALAVVTVLSQREDCERLTDAQRAELDRIGRLILFHEIEGQGRVFYRSPDSSAVAIPIGRAVSAASMPHEGWFETVPDRAGLLRVYSEPYRSRVGRRGLIHVVESLGDIVQPLATLRFALLVMAPLAILLSAAGGYWLAARALAPVDHITRMAREIEVTRLSQRLPAPQVQDEIGRLVDTFNQMIARLEASFEAMKRFTADASHELRGPLATMRGAIDVALSLPRDVPEYREVLASVGEDVDRLRSITEDLLILARADSGRIRLDRGPVRLDVLAAEVGESFQSTAVRRGVSLSAECREPVVVLGDERWLRQLAVNLVDNAVKFSPNSASPGSLASVTVRVTGTDGVARLDVADSGPGIPAEDFDRIFERFYRADRARPYGGNEGCGLGLAIAAWIVEAHGGTIRAQNRRGGGSLFSVTFPVVAAAPK